MRLMAMATSALDELQKLKKQVEDLKKKKAMP